jgi:hypothetical protein
MTTRSGTASRTNASRGPSARLMVTLTLSREAIARLAELSASEGRSRSAIVDELIMSRPVRRRGST